MVVPGVRGTLSLQVAGWGRVRMTPGFLPDRGTDEGAPGLVERECGPGGIRLVFQARHRVRLDRVVLELPCRTLPGERFFLNGWQSWTDSREFRPGEGEGRLSFRASLAEPWQAFSAYGDRGVAGARARRGEAHGVSWCCFRRGEAHQIVASLDEDSAFTTLRPGTDMLRLERDCRGRVLVPGDRFVLFDLFLAHGSESGVYDAWMHALEARRGVDRVCLPSRPALGFTTWYRHYEDISEDKVRRDLEGFRTCLPPPGPEDRETLFQIDDGWQSRVGDWLEVSGARFPRGLEMLTGEIHAAGCRAGLWLAPFAALPDSKVVRQHPEWVLRDPRGKAVKAGGNWGGFLALDASHPGYRDWMRSVLETVLGTWGFDMVKLDFLYAACLVPGPSATRGEQMASAMEFLHRTVKGVGADRMMLACGVPLASAFGRTEYCRVGCDMSLDWADAWWDPFLHRERVSARRSVGNSLYRRHLDGRFFRNDPDVVVLRDDTALDAGQRALIHRVNCLCGSLVFTSDYLPGLEGEARRLWDATPRMMACGVDRLEDLDHGPWRPLRRPAPVGGLDFCAPRETGPARVAMEWTDGLGGRHRDLLDLRNGRMQEEPHE